MFEYAKDVLISYSMIEALKHYAKPKYKTRANQIKRALECLDEEERELISLFYLYNHKLSIVEVADKLNYSERTVRRKRDEALRKFECCLHMIEKAPRPNKL
jgi:RNA polymerase sigma factor (sigma-70 family)